MTARLRRKILIVEDDPHLRETLADLLTTAGYQVVQAGDGEIALQYLRRVGDFLILLDFTLPKVSGQEILRQLHTDPRLARNHRVIVISALVDEAHADALLSDTVVAVLPKPFRLPKLLNTISRFSEKA